MRVLQGRAEVDPGLSELVVAYTRLCSNRNVLPEFFETDHAASQRVTAAAWWQKEFVERNSNLDIRVLAFLLNFGAELRRRRVPVILQPEDLAFRLGISMRQLRWLAHAKTGRYQTFEISKSNGKVREIHAPCSKLKTVQGWIAKKILSKENPHRYATAYTPGSKLADNANPHVSRNVVVRMDLKDFFPSITYKQVRKVFSRFGYSYSVAGILANICCHDGKLVQGAPSSPALSNLVAKNLDNRIEGIKRSLAERDKKIFYSRYADDLIFSFDDQDTLGVLPFIRQIIRDEGFTLNEDKLKIMRSGGQQKVTGVVVNDRLNVPSQEYRKLRAVLHNIRSHGMIAEMERWQEASGKKVRSPSHFQQILRGKIAFIQSVNLERGKILLDQFLNIGLAQS